MYAYITDHRGMVWMMRVHAATCTLAGHAPLAPLYVHTHSLFGAVAASRAWPHAGEGWRAPPQPTATTAAPTSSTRLTLDY